MKLASRTRLVTPVMAALLLSLGIASAPVLAQGAPVVQELGVQELGVQASAGRVVQDDPDNPIKFSIDPAIATGSVSTSELFIGTVESYLGNPADGTRAVFQDGFGENPNDILIMNDRVGIVLAAGTADPWGYPGGSILDAGRVTPPAGSPDLKGATFGVSTVLTAQFLFNSWDAWAPSNAGMVYFDLVNYNFTTKSIDDVNGMPAVQVTRKFTVPYNLGGVSNARDLDVKSYYSIGADKDYAYWIETIHNNGAAFATEAVNEMVISNKGAVGVDTKTVAALTAANTYNWVAGDPARQFSTTLISPGLNLGSDGRAHPFSGFTGARGYRELQYNPATRPYVPGETRSYESYLMIDDQASWQKVYDFWADYKGLQKFNVSGAVTDSAGAAVSNPVVIVYRGSALYGWVLGDETGHYSIDLPNENAAQTYNLRIEKDGTVPGAPSADFTSATVPGGGLNLQTGGYKVPVKFNFQDQNGDPIWGRVSVGANPVVSFTGRNFFFSDNGANDSVDKGKVTALVAPGNYSATAWGEGYGFYSYTTNTTTFSRNVTGNTTSDPSQTVVINKPLSAPADWFSVDNHHHGTRSDAFSPPEVVAKAQVTAGLEVPTLDDHQYVLDNCPVYNWARRLGATGYMPSEEVTPSWGHHDIMPMTRSAYTRFRDCAQKNPIVNTNATHQGILDDGHNAGVAIGANHPNSSYGLLLADDDHTVPGGLSEDFDGLEAQFTTTTLNEAFAFWNAYLTGGTHRGVTVKRPHYIYASTDIHDSGGTTSSGGRRSYVYLADGKSKSQTDFDDFSIEFGRSQAAGHSFNSSGVFIKPTSGKVYGNTYRADQSGSFTADFNVSALNDITDIYVFSSTGTGIGTGSFPLRNLVSRTTYVGPDATKSKDFTLTANNVQGRQWYALAAVSSNNRLAITNPIWVNGPDVPATRTITAVDPILNSPKVPTDGGEIEQPATAIMTTAPWSGFLFSDWESEGGSSNRFHTLTFTAPDGFAFDPALEDAANGIQVSNDGVHSLITYRVDLYPPVAASKPTITGAAKVGEALTADPGTWEDGVAFSYLWAVDGTDLATETGTTYTPSAGDVGKTVTVKVTGAKPGRTSVTKESDPTAAVVGPPVSQARPVVTGRARHGDTLTTDTGSWASSADQAPSYSIEWLRCLGGVCDTIPDADQSTYRLTTADVGARLRSRVTATDVNGSARDRSAATAVVAEAAPVLVTRPVVSGPKRVGSTLSVTEGEWDNNPTGFTYQWRRCDSAGVCTDIPGADASTYTLGSSDEGKRLRALVTASNAGGRSRAITSATRIISG